MPRSTAVAVLEKDGVDEEEEEEEEEEDEDEAAADSAPPAALVAAVDAEARRSRTDTKMGGARSRYLFDHVFGWL